MEEPEHNGHDRPLDIGNTSDAIVESQPTQLLDFVLGKKAEPPSLPPRINNAQTQPHGNDDTSSSADHSSHSKASVNTPPFASALSYHFHGLASTQSPTQFLSSEDSQKENEHAYACSEKLPSGRGRGSSMRDARSRISNCVQPSSKGALTPSRALTEPLLTRVPPLPTRVLTPSQQSVRQNEPTKESTKSAGMRYRRRPSPPIPSQDSFAGPPVSQDPDLFIATSRQFDIPLDQLGRSNRSSSQDRSPVESRVAHTSVTSSDHVVAQPAMDDYSLSSSSSAGKILVANSDSSGPSQDSSKSRNNFYSISQEPTQLNSDGSASVAGMSDHADNEEEAEAEPADEVADASTRVEPTQTRTQEATQVVEQSPSAEIAQTSAPEPSVVSEKLSVLSLVPPEKRAKYMHHFEQKGDAHPGPAPGPSHSISTSKLSPAEPPSPAIVPDKRSLLSALPPEKLGRYMHHLQRNSVPVSEASRMATAGTSLGTHSSGNAGNARSTRSKSPPLPPPPPIEEEGEVVQGSEQQVGVAMSISPVKPVRGKKIQDRDQEVVPPSESDAADNSREEEEIEMGLEAEEDTSVKPPSGASVKGKQKADPSPGRRSPCKPADSGRGGNSGISASERSPAGLVTRSTVLGSPVKLQVPKKAGDAEMAPPPVPQVRHGQSRSILKGFPNARGPPPVASTSAAAMHRVQRPSPTPASVGDSETDSPEIPLARIVGRRMEEEEEESEAAIDEDMITEEEDEKPAGRKSAQSSRKRKRRNVGQTAKKAGKGKTPVRKVTTRATTVTSPPTKKARTSMSITKKFGAGIGTQVFALFKSDSCFYGAEVHSLNGNRAHVKFFDGLEDTNLGVAQMRRFDLRVGDIVIPGTKAYKANVIDDSLWASENEVNVEYTEGPEEGLEFGVPADALRIPSRTIQSQWKDRTLDPSEIIPAVQRKSLKDTPSPSKNSVVNSAPARSARNKSLSKYGIIITQAPGNQNWAREKEKYISIIKDNGGTVLSDWLEVFSLHGKHTNGNKRWTILRSDVKYASKDKHTFDRVFLISDIHNQKPKYLLALALGIPCVSTEWLDHIASGEELSWSQFLLAAGHSEPLGAPISQMVDLNWGSAAEHLTEIMENAVPLKVLRGKSVLCLGSDLFPRPAKKATTDADRHLEASRTVPRIILAMGAERVEAVADAKHASGDLSEYDYVVVKEGIPHPRVRNATYVDVTWIKECLIAGRLLPVPDWEE